MPGLQMCNSKEFFPRNWYDRIIRGITANQITLQVIPLVSIEMWPRIYATGTIDSFFAEYVDQWHSSEWNCKGII